MVLLGDVTLNRAVAVAMTDGPRAGLAQLEEAAPRLAGHHRLDAVRAHLLEQAGDRVSAAGTTRRRRTPFLAARRRGMVNGE